MLMIWLRAFNALLTFLCIASVNGKFYLRSFSQHQQKTTVEKSKPISDAKLTTIWKIRDVCQFVHFRIKHERMSSHATQFIQYESWIIVSVACNFKFYSISSDLPFNEKQCHFVSVMPFDRIKQLGPNLCACPSPNIRPCIKTN